MKTKTTPPIDRDCLSTPEKIAIIAVIKKTVKCIKKKSVLIKYYGEEKSK